MAEVSRGRGSSEPLAVFAGNAADDLATASARIALQAVFLAFNAAEAVHAVVLTLVRLGLTGRRLLDWETAAAVARRSGSASFGAFARAMASSPAIAVISTGAIAAARPDALPAAAPVLLVWLLAPVIGWRLSQPTSVRQRPLSPADAAELRAIALRTWHYFDTFMTPDDNDLPPDNVQWSPEQRVAHRTSPTNIAMAMLSVLSS
jgi:cyclic beta-1,2-glucan synthetase